LAALLSAIAVEDTTRPPRYAAIRRAPSRLNQAATRFQLVKKRLTISRLLVLKNRNQRPTLLTAAFLAVATARDRRFPRLTTAVAVVMAVVLVGYAAVVQCGPRVNNGYGLRFQATAQKIMFVVSMAGIAYLSLIAERLSSETPSGALRPPC
jgi:hypothetical protein